MSREIGDLVGVAEGLAQHGHLLVWQGDYEQARQLLEESLAVARSVAARLERDIVVSPLTFEVLGQLYFHQGDVEQARAYLEESLSLNRQTGRQETIPWILARLGQIYVRQNELAQAGETFTRALVRFAEAGPEHGVHYTLEGWAGLAIRQHEPERALRFIAWADARREAMLDYRPPSEQAEVDRDLALIREMIDETTYAAAYAEGQAMMMAQIVAYALGDSRPSGFTRDYK